MRQSGWVVDPRPSFRPEDLSEKWTIVLGTPVGDQLREELGRELAVGHVLHGALAHPVAVRQHGKETIWWLPDKAAWAVVHLTSQPETDPRWPSAVQMDTWDEVLAELADRGRP